jgi:hypothetical protein
MWICRFAAGADVVCVIDYFAVNAGKNKPGAAQTVSGKPAAKLEQETEDFHREFSPGRLFGSPPIAHLLSYACLCRRARVLEPQAADCAGAHSKEDDPGSTGTGQPWGPRGPDGRVCAGVGWDQRP